MTRRLRDFRHNEAGTAPEKRPGSGQSELSKEEGGERSTPKWPGIWEARYLFGGDNRKA